MTSSLPRRRRRPVKPGGCGATEYRCREAGAECSSRYGGLPSSDGALRWRRHGTKRPSGRAGRPCERRRTRRCFAWWRTTGCVWWFRFPRHTRRSKTGTRFAFTVAAYPGQRFSGRSPGSPRSGGCAPREPWPWNWMSITRCRLAPGTFLPGAVAVHRSGPSLFVPAPAWHRRPTAPSWYAFAAVRRNGWTSKPA